MANAEANNEVDPATTMRVVNPRSVAKLVEPYHTCPIEEGLTTAEPFPTRSIESVQKYIEVLRPRMKAYKERDMEATFESPCYSVEDHFTLNGDGLLSVCMRVHDETKDRHKIATYDHTTKELKTLGYIKRHKFVMDIDTSVICMNDPAYVEGVIGALTEDGNFFVVLAHSKGLRTVNVFDIANTTCLFEMDCSRIDFLNCGPTGIALDPKGVRHGQFNIAILSENMEIRLWNGATLAGSAVRLEDVCPSFYMRRYVINPRESAVRFSPDGRLLSVLAAFLSPEYSCYLCVCILMDAVNLECLCMLPYKGMYGPLCSLFPSFSKCRSKIAMFACLDENQIMDLDEYKFLFFEIPFRMETLKTLCKSSILNLVSDSMLNKLPLPDELIAYLSDNNRMTTSPENVLGDNKKQCNVM